MVGEFFVHREYPWKWRRAAMENAVPTQIEKTFDDDSLLLASIVLRDVNQIRTAIQTIAAMVLHYAAMGSVITNSVMGLIMPSSVEEK
jgi:hypothetical protein